MSSKNYGDISLVIKIAELFVPFLLLGFDCSLTKLLPPLLTKEHKKEAQRLLSALFRMMGSRIFLILFAACTGVCFVTIMDTRVLEHTKHHYPFLLVCFLIPLIAITVIFNKIMISYKKYYSSAILFNVIKHGLCAFSLLVLFSKVPNVSFYSVYEVLLFSYFLVALLQSFYIAPIIKKNISPIENVTFKKSWLKLSNIYMFNKFSYSFLSTIDLLMLNLLGTDDSIGYFKALLVISSSLLIIVRASSSFSSPETSVLFHQNNFSALQKWLNKVFLFDLTISIMVMLVIISFRFPLLALFGKDYMHLGFELFLMSLTMIFVNLNVTFARLLVYTNCYQANMIINVISILIAFVLGIVFIPILDLKGAILSFLVINITQLCVRFFFIKKHLPIKPFVIL